MRIPILIAKTPARTLAAGAARAERTYSKESSTLSDTWGSPISPIPPDTWPGANTSAVQSPPESPISNRGELPLHPRVRRLTQNVGSAEISGQQNTAPNDRVINDNDM